MELKQIKRRKVAFSDYAGESDFYKTIFKTIGGDPITVQIPTRIPEKVVVALFSGVLVNSGIQVVADRLKLKLIELLEAIHK